MHLEGWQIHLEIKHAFDKLAHLSSCQIGKTRNQKIRDVIAQERRVCRPWGLLRRIEERQCNLIHLYQMEHESQ